MLSFNRYRFCFQAQDPLHLPTYPGSALRGIFGHGLRQSVCVTRLRECNGCALRGQCAYSYLFETSLYIGKGGNAPHPLVLDLYGVERHYAPGATFSIEITLIGNGDRHLPYIIQAWRRAGVLGLGRENARFSLERVDVLDFQTQCWRQLMPQTTAIDEPVDDAAATYQDAAPEQHVRIEISTPYRVKLDGHLVTPERFTAQGFVVALIKRVATLQSLHDPNSQPIDTGQLIDATADLSLIESRLRWMEWIRHSSRQRTHMQMGGVTGVFSLAGAEVASLWPMLQLGQWLHAGKNTLFGLGRYRIIRGVCKDDR